MKPEPLGKQLNAEVAEGDLHEWVNIGSLEEHKHEGTTPCGVMVCVVREGILPYTRAIL